MLPSLRPLWRTAYWLPRDVANLWRARLPEWVVYCGGTGFGDDLLLTSVLEELRRRGWSRLAVLSRHEELFRHGPGEIRFMGEDWGLLRAARLCGARVTHPKYLLGQAPDHDIPSRSHLITEMCRSAGLAGSVALRPYFYLTEEEQADGRISARQAVIQCTSPETMPFSSLKHWSAEGWQRVVDLLAGELDFVQLGSIKEPALTGVRDLRGKTSIRESAAILAGSRLNLGYVGFLMHLARAVDCRSVVVFGGRERPDQSGYACNENLFTALPCSPCWRYHESLHERECLTRIRPEDVAAAVRRALARGSEPLALTEETIPAAAEPFTPPWMA